MGSVKYSTVTISFAPERSASGPPLVIAAAAAADGSSQDPLTGSQSSGLEVALSVDAD